MQRLIIVGGASGAGKSYFLEQAQKNRKITPIKKYLQENLVITKW